MKAEILTRRFPGHHWVRLGLSFTGKLEPGHRWQYGGIIRRDAWRIGPVGVYLLRMPHQTEQQAMERTRGGS